MQRTPKGTPDASPTVPPEGFPIFRIVPPEGFATRGPFHPKASRPVGPFHLKASRSAVRSTRRFREPLDRSARRLSGPQPVPPEGFPSRTIRCPKTRDHVTMFSFRMFVRNVKKAKKSTFLWINRGLYRFLPTFFPHSRNSLKDVSGALAPGAPGLLCLLQIVW